MRQCKCCVASLISRAIPQRDSFGLPPFRWILAEQTGNVRLIEGSICGAFTYREIVGGAETDRPDGRASRSYFFLGGG
jgi:hypothetical protein